jgi:hypothetical protein
MATTQIAVATSQSRRSPARQFIAVTFMEVEFVVDVLVVVRVTAALVAGIGLDPVDHSG